MATMQLLRNVIDTNRDVIGQIKRLNARAGSMKISEWDIQQVTKFLKERLAGAASLADIKDVTKLVLPNPDPTIVAEIMRDNPDVLRIDDLDMRFPVRYVVEYGEQLVPTIRIDDFGRTKDYWQFLPDEGVKLPSGRLVTIEVYNLDERYFSGNNIPVLKQQLKDFYNARQLANLGPGHIPTLTTTEGEIPPILTAECGKCVVEGVPLIAYGVVVNVRREYNGQILAGWRWLTNQVDAKRQHDASVRQLAAIRDEITRQERMNRDREELDTLKKQINLYSQAYARSSSFPAELRMRLVELANNFYFSFSPPVELIAKAKQVVADIKVVEAAEKTKQEKKPAYLKETRNFVPRAYVFAQPDGTVYMYCGKGGMGGTFDVSIKLDAVINHGPGIISHVPAVWRQVPTDTELLVRQVVKNGKRESIVGMFTFSILAGKLQPGVWAAAEDRQGKFFYPAIYFTDKGEIIPDAVTIVR